MFLALMVGGLVMAAGLVLVLLDKRAQRLYREDILRALSEAPYGTTLWSNLPQCVYCRMTVVAGEPHVDWRIGNCVSSAHLNCHTRAVTKAQTRSSSSAAA